MPSLHQKNCISCSLSLTAATDVECTVQFSFYLIFLGFFFEFQVFVQNISKEKV